MNSKILLSLFVSVVTVSSAAVTIGADIERQKGQTEVFVKEEIPMVLMACSDAVIQEEENNSKVMEVPSGNTAFKAYMDYRCITNTRSAQYRLQQGADTNEYGLRTINGYYMIALGSAYADHIGEIFKITLDNGSSFKAVIGDFKADRDTDSTNRYSPMSEGKKNVVEFIVDTPCMSRTVRQMGDISYVSGFDGNVIGIEKVGEYYGE